MGVLNESMKEKFGRSTRTSGVTALAWLAVSTSLLGLSATAAQAQEAPSTAQPDAAYADEIIVTARKRAESLQDTSMALSVVDEKLLERRQISDVNGLQGVVPTITIGETVGMLKINIRGLGNSTNTRSEDSDVVLYEDGAAISRMEAQSSAFFDLQRVEVLRGPQGTLYGRNSTGGAINLITRKPTDTFEGYVDATLGNYGLVKTDAAVSGPLSSTLSARAAITATNRGGYGKNIATGADIEDQKRYAGRLQLLFKPSDRFQFLLSGEYAKQDDASGFFGYLAPLFPFANPPVAPRGAGGFSDPTSRDVASNFDPQLKKETWSVTGTLDYKLTDDLSIRNVMNYRKLNFFIAQDLDTSTVSTPTYVSIPLKDKQFSEEFQFIYDTDRIHAIAGLYYFYEKFGGETGIGTGPNTGIYFRLLGESKTEAFAPFFNVAFDVNDAITLRVGGRYNSDKRSIANSTILNGTLSVPAIANTKRTLSAYTGEYGVDWNITDRAMVYYTFSQGFRSGAALIFQSTSPIIDPTKVQNHEIGLKFESDDRTFYANVAAFTAKVTDLQRTQASISPITGLLSTRVNNIEAMRNKGVEFDAGWTPVPNLSLHGSAAYLSAKFIDFQSDDPIIQGTNVVQLAGNSTQQAPRWKWNAGAEFTMPFSNGSSLVASGDVSYQSSVWFDEFNRAPFAEGGYALVDASLTYHFVGDQLRLSVWGKNLTDQDRFADVSFSAFGQVISKQWIAPRTVGATIHYDF
ncbi:MAG: TonB-dependent receptor [Sphingorhabdus sp.]